MAALMAALLTATAVAGAAATAVEAIASIVIRPTLQIVTETSATVEVVSDLGNSGQTYPLPFELYPYSGEKDPVSPENRLLLSPEEMESLGDAFREGDLKKKREILEFQGLSGGAYLLVFPRQTEDGEKDFREEALLILLPGNGSGMNPPRDYIREDEPGVTPVPVTPAPEDPVPPTPEEPVTPTPEEPVTPTPE
ncbi:MAG: hypothetical protein ILO68_01710, partial [Clostridia bacterium]|nr:hypothetical protein [Clostridia bacterium]